MASWEEVRAFALALPGVEESSSHNDAPALKVRGKLIACQPADRQVRDGGRVLVLMDVPLDERAALIEAEPDVFFANDHFRDYPAVLVRLPATDLDRIRPYLERSWRRRAPRRLQAEPKA
jgi:hypothetical protein